MTAVHGRLDNGELRQTFGTFATGVTVVTVGGAEPHGMTANSFTTVSLDPALVLVCVARDAIMHQALAASRVFGVSVLAAGQEDVGRYFADSKRPIGRAQFDYVDSSPGPATGVPLIDGAVARYECELWRGYDGGDHTIFVGQLVTLQRGQDDDVLVFLRGKFRRLDQAPRDLVS